MTTDLLILGAGPAGCAAALRARQDGLSVVMLEAHRTPRPSPGETLHPGVEGIFAQLGVREQVLAAGFHRHRGIWLEYAGHRRFEPYGNQHNTAWCGFQADRVVLHGILQNAAIAAGVELIRPAIGKAPFFVGSRVAGVRVDGQEYRARWIADATGRHAWLARALSLRAEQHSPTLRARFGWSKHEQDGLALQPLLQWHSAGWDWRAPLGGGKQAWVELRAANHATVSPATTVRGIDVSWRLYPACAGPGYFLLGDAAAQLDPASANGVLRALMSGILASHIVGRLAQGVMTDQMGVEAYIQWITAVYKRYVTGRASELDCAPQKRDLPWADLVARLSPSCGIIAA
jgi:flavin-dependent dehydrogenase